jgi:hypothetical protein
MTPLPMLWTCLVKAGETGPRCGSTEQIVVAAVSTLEAALGPLGIDEAAFQAEPSESNRVWIAGKPQEK